MKSPINTALINKGKALPLWFDITDVRSSTSVSPDTTTQVIEDDKIISRSTTSVTGEEAALIVNIDYSIFEGPINFTYTSDNPTEIDVNYLGNIVFQVEPEQTSSARITITATQGSTTVSRFVDVTLTVSGASVVDVIEGGVEGSARKALSDPIDTALVGADLSTQLYLYTEQDHDAASYTRNTSFFLNSHVEALTCASPWNSRQGKFRAGTAVTKRHVLLATHYSLKINDTIRFITSDNTVITKTIVQAKAVPYDGPLTDSNYNTDSWVVLLDSDLPSSITPCKIFPSSFSSFLPSNDDTSDVLYGVDELPLLILDQDEKGLVHDLWNLRYDRNTPRAVYKYPTLEDRVAFYERVVSGDSGNPAFVAIGTELWLVGTLHTAGYTPYLGALITEINTVISELDALQGDITGYTVTEGDLSSFNTY